MKKRHASSFVLRSEGRAYRKKVPQTAHTRLISRPEEKQPADNSSTVVFSSEQLQKYLETEPASEQKNTKTKKNGRLKEGLKGAFAPLAEIWNREGEREEERVHEPLFIPRKKPRSFALSIVFTSLILSMVLIGMLGFAALGAAGGIAKAYIHTTPPLDTAVITDQDQTSYIYDKNGELITTLAGLQYREWASIDEIPVMLQNAFIAIEDVRFRYHNGVDLKRFANAAMGALTGTGSSGGSTITQQLIKNTILTNETSYKRKIQEIYLAVELEKLYDKDEILEAYLNVIPLGGLNYGVKATAADYFGKELNELTIRECAMLAGLTQSPSRYDPRYNTYSKPERMDKYTNPRTDEVLEKMYKAGFITLEQKEAALKEEVHIVKQSTATKMYEYPHFVEYAVYDVTTHLLRQRNLQDNSANRRAIRSEIATGGYHIYTTLDPQVQSTLEKSVADWEEYPALQDPANSTKTYTENGVTYEIVQPQVASVVMDYHSGQIAGIVGSRETPTGRNQLNRAYQSHLSVGSSIKPLTVYGPALDLGASPASIILNYATPIEGWESTKGYPTGGLTKQGPVTLRVGLKYSYNVVAARTLLELVGTDTAKQYLLDLGVNESNIQSTPAGLALGVTSMTTLEMTAAFGAIANQGTYLEPVAFTKVLDSEGKTVLDASESQVVRQVYKPSTAYLLTSMMRDAVSGGTGTKAKIDGITVAGKTGTNSDYRSVYFAGYTPYYVSALWIGHDDDGAKLKSGSTGGTYAAPLWADYMSKIHEGLEDREIFSQTPSELGLVQRKVCSVSGLLATDACALDEKHKPVLDYFQAEYAPVEECNMHVRATICQESLRIAGAYCPESQCVQRGLLVIPEDSQLFTIPEELLRETFPEAKLGLSAQQLMTLLPGTPEYAENICDLHTAFNWGQPTQGQVTDAQELVDQVYMLVYDESSQLSEGSKTVLLGLASDLQSSLNYAVSSAEIVERRVALEKAYSRALAGEELW